MENQAVVGGPHTAPRVKRVKTAREEAKQWVPLTRFEGQKCRAAWEVGRGDRGTFEAFQEVRKRSRPTQLTEGRLQGWFKNGVWERKLRRREESLGEHFAQGSGTRLAWGSAGSGLLEKNRMSLLGRLGGASGKSKRKRSLSITANLEKEKGNRTRSKLGAGNESGNTELCVRS